MEKINESWLPTAKNINALPGPVRDYIADMQTNADPPSMVADNIILRDTVKALEIKLEEKLTVDEKFLEKWKNHLLHEHNVYQSHDFPEHYKLLLGQMLTEAGVEIWLG